MTADKVAPPTASRAAAPVPLAAPGSAVTGFLIAAALLALGVVGVRDALVDTGERILSGLLALAGIVSENMVRDAGWYLLDTGRGLERALQVLALLQRLQKQRGLSYLLTQAVQYAVQHILYAPGLIFALAEYRGQIEPPFFLMGEAGDKHTVR